MLGRDFLGTCGATAGFLIVVAEVIGFLVMRGDVVVAVVVAVGVGGVDVNVDFEV